LTAQTSPRQTSAVTGARRAALLVALAVCPALALAATAPAARAASGDVATTRAYVEADYRLMRSAVNKLPEAEAALEGLLRSVRANCAHGAAGSPQNALSTQMSDEVIGAMVIAVVDPGLPVARRFVREAQGLHWSSSALTATVQAYVSHVRTLTQLAAPDLCLDVHTWAASGFATLPASTQTFVKRFMPAWVAAGELPGALTRYEQSATRALAARAMALEERFSAFEAREVYTWGHIMDALELWP
jgi:hypothetical protein